jgi:hypothetical protein
VIEWYEVRWQIELLFRELKSRLQVGCYVLRKFEAVERYLDLLLMGFLLRERERLRDLERAGPPAARGGESWVQARTTDRLRALEALCAEWNLHELERRLQTPRGRQRLLRDLRRTPCRVAGTEAAKNGRLFAELPLAWASSSRRYLATNGRSNPKSQRSGTITCA